jgi:hypothetical protein
VFCKEYCRGNHEVSVKLQNAGSFRELVVTKILYNCFCPLTQQLIALLKPLSPNIDEQVSVCGFEAGEQLLSVIVAIVTASISIGISQIFTNVVNSSNLKN